MTSRNSAPPIADRVSREGYSLRRDVRAPNLSSILSDAWLTIFRFDSTRVLLGYARDLSGESPASIYVTLDRGRVYCTRVLSEFRICPGYFQRDIDKSTAWRWRLPSTRHDKGFDMLSSSDSRRTRIDHASPQLDLECVGVRDENTRGRGTTVVCVNRKLPSRAFHKNVTRVVKIGCLLVH